MQPPFNATSIAEQGEGGDGGGTTPLFFTIRARERGDNLKINLI
jgi:hypothetical protein